MDIGHFCDATLAEFDQIEGTQGFLMEWNFHINSREISKGNLQNSMNFLHFLLGFTTYID